MLYYMSFDEGDNPEDKLPLSDSLTKATDIFIELASHQACGVGLVDSDGVRIGHWTGYGDGYGVVPSLLTFIGPEEDHAGNEAAAADYAATERTKWDMFWE